MNTFNEEIHKKADRIADLVISKQQDYGKGNILNSVIKPELAILVRLQDKLSRAANLIENGKTAKNESLQDTADDIVGYGLILGMVLNETFKLPLEVEDDKD